MGRVQLSIKRLPHGKGLPLPQYATPGSSGLDLSAAIADSVTLLPGERVCVPTGICVAVPEGYEAQVRPRSGLALKHGLGMVNAPGTIDSDYRGEVKVLLINLGTDPVVIRRGDRIAQLIVAPVVTAEVIEVDDLPPTARGSGGFGHTGTSAPIE